MVLRAEGKEPSKRLVFGEACAAKNSSLVYNGYTPQQSLVGRQGRQLFEFDKVPGISATYDNKGPEVIEEIINFRNIAVRCLQEEIMTQRLGCRCNAKMMKYNQKLYLRTQQQSVAGVRPGRKKAACWQGCAAAQWTVMDHLQTKMIHSLRKV